MKKTRQITTSTALMPLQGNTKTRFAHLRAWLKPSLSRALPLAASCFAALAMSSHAAPILRITEVMSNGDTVDWFEVTNYGDTAATITGYQMDDNSFSVTASLALSGVTTINPGESVVFTEGTAANPTLNVAQFKTNWSLDASKQVGGYGGSGVGLSAGGDGVTLFTNSSANSGTELPGPFSGLIRVSFGAATTGTSFNWAYSETGASISPATGQLTTAGITWSNAGTTMLATPGSTTPLVSITATDASAAEAPTPDTGAFRITRTGSTTGSLAVTYTMTTGSGQAVATDYSPTLTGTATILNGQSSVDITITPTDDILLEGDETVTLNLVDAAAYDPGSSTTATVTITDNETSIDLSRYVRIGRYDLPEPTRTTAPSGSLLAQEASNVTYNWDTDTLFVTGDGGTSVVQVSKTGQLINSMTLAAGSSPQGTEFYDTEGLTYIGNGQFVMTEERNRQLVKFTYVPGTTLVRSATQTVKLGTTIGNIGLEGVCYDPQTSGATPGFIVVKEKDPKSVFQTNVDFVNLTATNGSPTATSSTDLFNPSLVPTSDFSDVFVLSNLPALNGKSTSGDLLIISQESGQIVHCDRLGNVLSTLTLVADADNPLTIPDQTHEGVTMDRSGIIYTTNENGGGDSNHPQLWVWAPSIATNQPPTAVLLNNKVTSIPDNTSTAVPVKVADIVVMDDGLGVNNLTISGADAASFEITGTALFLKAGTVLNAASQSSYGITVSVDGVDVGTIPDASIAYSLSVTVAVGGTAHLVITEVAPWSSSNSSLLADWFEVTNTGTATANITGWTVDDNSNSFAASLLLNGITNIAPGESVIFIETSNLAAAQNTFRSIWFGGNPPAGLQIGNYTGSGIGLSTGGDAVNLFDAGGTVQANVSFGTNVGSGTTFQTFDNADLLNNTLISTFSAVGVHGAFSVSDVVGTGTNTLVGSPGTMGASSTPMISITATDASAAEAASDPGTFRISRSSSTVSPLTFSYILSGTSLSEDYSPTLNGAATIPSGQSYLDITITPVDDALNEGNETLIMTLGDTGSYDVGTPSVATITITDNDNPNQAPTAVTLSNTVPSLIDSTSTSSAVRVADITIVDDLYGTNTLSLSGADASAFIITGSSLYLKSGTALNSATKSAYNVTVNVDDTSLGSTPDASVNFTLTITQAVPAGTIIISEVAPFGSSIAAIGADWVEITNVGTAPISTAGWKMDDNSNAFATAVPMSTLIIAPGESVIFFETTNLSVTSAAFKTAWFGGNPPSNLQFGSYTGSGVGLSGSGDAVNLFDSGGTRFAGVAFGSSATASPFLTFDNKAGLNSATLPLPVLATFSIAGVNGAFVAVNDSGETGSPGSINPINNWRLQYFGNTSNTGSTADTADFDGDGVSNLVEYALGVNPTSASPAQGGHALPSGITNESDPLLSNRLGFSFDLDSQSPADITYTVQATDDLLTWTDLASKTGNGSWAWLPGGTARIVITPAGARVNVVVGDMVSLDDASRRMMRLKVARQ